MFGFQRVGDLIWAAGDLRTRGFLIGATAGRTTLAGEGLQHQDGHSHLLAYPVPPVRAYDPAFAYEIAVIIQDGIRTMYEKQEDLIYYLTVGNENYQQPAVPTSDTAELKRGIIRGIYPFHSTEKNTSLRVNLLGSGAIMNCVLKAQNLLLDDFGVGSDVWSVTSYKSLHQDAVEVERRNHRNPAKEEKLPFVAETLSEASGVFVAASDYVKALPESISKWIPGRLISLGTDGFGRSDSREALRDFFEVDERHIAAAALAGLAKEGKIKPEMVVEAIRKFEINPDKANPLYL
jgi:pyruvate dehydrogenase E1 component